MTIQLSMQDLTATAPLVIVAVAVLAVLLVDALVRRSAVLVYWLTIAGFAGAFAFACAGLQPVGTAYSGMISTGGFANFFAALFSAAGLLAMLISHGYLSKEGLPPGEYSALLLLSAMGMMLMAAAMDLVIFFLGLELMSVCFYVLAGLARRRATSNEAALKYFLLGAFATGFLLYGIALLYGATGTTQIDRIVSGAGAHVQSPMFLIGLALLLVGLAFKVAAVPFHMWAPDVYEGAPTPISGFMSTGGKAAAFSVFLLIFAPRLINVVGELRTVLAALAALSMVVGNVVAVSQSNVKRMLAYSSVAHAGYILTGILAGNATGANGVAFYLAAYTVMNLGAFGVVAMLESTEGKNLTFEEYSGLGARQPAVALLMTVFMFSLAGVPPFAGFFGKYYVFAGAVEGGFTWLAILGVLMSVVSAYYYLRLVVMMYFKEQAGGQPVAVPPLAYAGLLLSAVALLVLGLYPSALLNLTTTFF
jgi:NADH-quinone oxidoreductase subunit N